MIPRQMAFARLRAQDEGSLPSTHTGLCSKSLYISHCISTWNSRGFEFGAVLFLSTIYPGTLLPMSVYALARALAAIVLSPAVGRYIDNSNRLQIIRVSIVGQRLAVAASCAAFLCLLLLKDAMPTSIALAVFVCLIFLACVEKLCIIMNTISVERDWVVVIANENEGMLQEMNSQMRRIDLFCKLVSPLAIALVDGISTTVAVVFTFGLNSTSVLAEYFLIAWVYRKTPALANREFGRIPEPIEPSRGRSSHATSRWMASTVLGPLQSYTNSPAFLPSFSLAVLYLTVLSFSGQMITYLFALESPRLTSIHIGILRTIATVLEISSTFIAPILIDRLGAVRAGIWSLSWQFLCLAPGIATFWTSGFGSTTLTTYLFISTIILSRVGLWSFDLTAQLLVQNSVDASQRGSFSATESSLQNFFELCTFAMTIIWSRPKDFKYPATISLAAVYLASILYAWYVRVERGHLLHMPACCKTETEYRALWSGSDGEEVELEGTR